MSFRALVIPEDPIHDGHLLKPLVERMLAACGRPHARVVVLPNPRARGYEHAKRLLETQILDRYTHFHLLLFLPDADGKDRTDEFAVLEKLAAARRAPLLCCAAVPEVEAWMLAGHLDKLDRDWASIRTDRAMKEHVFAPFLAAHGDPRRAGGGRDVLMLETLRNYEGLLQRCPELAELQGKIGALLNRGKKVSG